MRLNWLKIIVLFLLVGLSAPAVRGQKIIEYISGMGTRDPNNPDVWILFQKVKAMHEGMILYTDSASFDTKHNIFVAHKDVKIIITDTTILYGKTAVYDGTTRVADVWGDTVRLIDGGTILKTDQLSYDRNTDVASYFNWGITTHDDAELTSRKGHYHSNSRDLFLYADVVLHDSSSRLLTDTLHYNTRTSLARFYSPTYIYSDSSTVYSEDGSYNTDSHQACSFKASYVANRDKYLLADTIYFNDNDEYGEAYGNVVIVDTLNDVTCSGQFGITDQQNRFSFVTDSALIVYVDKGDSLFMHADTIWAFNNEDNEFDAAKAYYNVRLFRSDVQCVGDSLYYSAADSSLTLFHNTVVWYEEYQCSADTIVCFFDSSGVNLILLKNSVFAIEKVDSLKFSQVKGRNARIYCDGGEPLYADILGSASMVYYVLDEDAGRKLLGVNVGVGSDMRIYFDKRKPSRVVTYGEPDMKMYPPGQVPKDALFLLGFEWKSNIKPRDRYDVFR